MRPPRSTPWKRSLRIASKRTEATVERRRLFPELPESTTTIASLLALYALVIVLTLLIARQLINAQHQLDRLVLRIVAVIAFSVPLALLIVVIVRFLRLIAERRRGLPGSALRMRLTVFFVLLLALSTLPQGVVAVGFVSAALERLFDSETGPALRGGRKLAADYYNARLRSLTVAVEHPAVLGALGEPSPRADELWRGFQAVYPFDAAMEFFDHDDRLLWQRGPSALYQESPPGPFARIGVVTRIQSDGIDALEAVLSADGGVVRITARLPDTIQETARDLTQALIVFEQLEAIQSTVLISTAVIFGVFASPMVLLAVMIGLVFAGRLVRPIQSLEEATERVASGDYSVRIVSRSSGDLGLLVLSFNRMVTELERAQRRIMQTEKVQAWQEIAQRFAHEVKNPLTPIRLAAERLKRRYDAGAPDFATVLHRTTTTIVREVEALTALLDTFRAFTRLPAPRFEPVTLRALVEEGCAVFIDDPRLTLRYDDVPADLVLDADHAQLRQVLVNLIVNAIESRPDGVRVEVSAHALTRSGAPFCRLVLRDDGPGIPPELREHVFDPYVTGKPHGTGLGLAIVERIVFDHDGSIAIDSGAHGGTTVTIDLPLRRSEAGG